MKTFGVKYWDGDDFGTYVHAVKVKAKTISEALDYAEDKYGSVFHIQEINLFYKDNEDFE